MNILHLTPYYTPAYAFGGVVRSVEGMTQALAERGHIVTVLTTDALDQTHRYTGLMQEVINGVRVVRVPNLSPWLRGKLNLSTPNGMDAIARDLLAEADIVHCHEFRTVENLLVTPLAAKMGIPLILSPHGTLSLTTGRSRMKAAWDRLLSSAVALRFDHVIGLTTAEVEAVQTLWSRFGRRRIPATFSVVPNGVNPAAYRDLPGRGTFRAQYGLGDGPVCLFMARLHPRKGAHLLAEAFRQADIPGARLVIAGPDEGGRALIEPFVDERVILTGYLGGESRLAAFAAADVFALPAVGEGLPMVVLEALAAGLPAIVSPECYLPEVALSGAGLEVSPDVAALAGALRMVLLEQERREAMQAAARQLVNERFTWSQIAAQLETAYDSTQEKRQTTT
ncbi:MAG: glycosyltransferase [Anaerolineaceae bacterium]|nr:glycosyltransferase [Anaerolineaceae bacterium]